MMMIMIPMITSKTIPEVLSKEVALIVVVSEKVFVKINSNSSWYKIALAMKSSLEGELFMRSWEWKGEKSILQFYNWQETSGKQLIHVM